MVKVNRNFIFIWGVIDTIGCQFIQVIKQLPKLLHHRVILFKCLTTFNGQRGDGFTSFFYAFNRYRHNKRKRLQQTHKLRVILCNTDMTNIAVRLQRIPGALIPLAKSLHDFFFTHGGQQCESGYLADWELFQPLSSVARLNWLPAFVGIDMDNTLQKRLAAVCISVLCNHNTAPERWFVCLVIIGFYPHSTGSALLGIIRGAIAFD